MALAEIHEANRLSWNAATAAHNRHKKDQARWLRDGGSTLFPEELDLLGGVSGKRVVHLLCNSGQDTLSLAALGADVTGVDISDTAIEAATELSRDSGIAARFHRADVYDWLAATNEQFDIVFASYGALIWLSDLRAWAHAVAGILKPGGRLVIMEFHPIAVMFDPDLALAFPYSSGGTSAVSPDGVTDYVCESGAALAPSGFIETAAFENQHPSHEFSWGLADVIGAILDAGLVVERFEEYFYSNGWKPFREMVQDGARYRLPPERPRIPVMFGLRASSEPHPVRVEIPGLTPRGSPDT